VPITVQTDEEKETIVAMLGGELRRGALMQELDILAKRARSSAVRSK